MAERTIKIRDRWFWIGIVTWLIIAPPAVVWIGYQIGTGWSPWR